MTQRLRRSTRRLVGCCAPAIVVTSLGALFVAPAGAAVGGLDPGFGPGGSAVSAVSFPKTVAVQPDGKIVVGGYLDGGVGSGNNFALARYNFDGSLDLGFGAGGVVTTAVSSVAGGSDWVNDIVIQPDGKIVATGYVLTSGSGNFTAIVRYNANGTLDSGFGVGGKVVTTVNADSFPAGDIGALSVQPDGKIVVGGYRTNVGTSLDFALVRYTSAGVLDSSFGGGDGSLDTHVTVVSGGLDWLTATLVQPDGKIVAGGYVDTVSDGFDFALVRYNADGTLDSGFDGDGKALTTIDAPSGSSFNDYLNAIVRQPDGKIVAGGYTAATSPGELFALARFNADGGVDTTFAGDGRVTTDVGPGADDRIHSLAVQPDGRVLAGGEAYVDGVSFEDWALARYNPDGSADASFDGDGKTAISFAAGEAEKLLSMAPQADGRIVAVGYSATNLVARFDAGQADLAVSAVASPAPFKIGDNVTFDLTVTNAGYDGTARSVLTDTLPAGAVLTSATPSQGVCGALATVVCELGQLAAGASATVRVVVAPGSASVLTNSASVDGSLFDPVPANNVVQTVVTRINQAPSASVSRPRKGSIRARKLKVISGRASDPEGELKRVQVAVLRLAGGVRAAKSAAARCLWLNRKGRFVARKATVWRRCAKMVCITARGTTRWSYKLRRRLPRGRYVIYARAIDAQGATARRFSAGRRNRVTIRVI